LEEEEKTDRTKLKRKSNNASLDETEGSSKKRGSNVSSMSIASNKSSASNKSTKSSKSVTSTKTARKHHYPTTQYELSEELRDQVVNNAQHGVIFRQLVDEIASGEYQTLEAHLNPSAASQSISGRRHIFNSLATVLSDLVTFVDQDCPDNATFAAEHTKADLAEIKALQQTKKLLQQHSDKLQSFENNISALAEEHDLWVGTEAITTKVKAAVKVGFFTFQAASK
jgi:transglutaminase/protease-like cytokinesis protein 3